MQRDGGPGGAGGAGNPVGGAFTGPAETLELVGDFAYAFSGGIGANTATQTALEFKTGNFILVGTFTYNTPIQENSPATGITASLASIYLNDSLIAILKVQSSPVGDGQGPAQGFQPVVIPPFTEVKMTFDSSDTVADRVSTGSLTGRIYRG